MLFRLLVKLNMLLVKLIRCIGVREEISDQVIEVKLLLKNVSVIRYIIIIGLLVQLVFIMQVEISKLQIIGVLCVKFSEKFLCISRFVIQLESRMLINVVRNGIVVIKFVFSVVIFFFWVKQFGNQVKKNYSVEVIVNCLR